MLTELLRDNNNRNMKLLLGEIIFMFLGIIRLLRIFTMFLPPISAASSKSKNIQAG
jgi:hypothetical protein